MSEADRAIFKTKRKIKQIESKAEMFIDAIARIGVNKSKEKSRLDTWTDRTGNLRASIDHELHHRKNSIKATVFAGMEYAASVHFRDGFRVLVIPEKHEADRLKKGLKL